MVYKLLYSKTARNQVRGLHPGIKPIVKSMLKRLKDDPFKGKKLERELSGYWSLIAKRFRIIYKVRDKKRVIEIHYVGHRKDIYELFLESITKE